MLTDLRQSIIALSLGFGLLSLNPISYSPTVEGPRTLAAPDAEPTRPRLEPAEVPASAAPAAPAKPVVRAVAAAPAALAAPAHDHASHDHSLIQPPAGSGCTLLVAAQVPLACTHGADPAPEGVDVSRYVPTEELQARGDDALYAETAARGGGSTDGSGQIACDGDGVSGKRVEALYVVASDRKDRYSALATSFTAWAKSADATFNRSARLTGGAPPALRHPQLRAEGHPRRCDPER